MQVAQSLFLLGCSLLLVVQASENVFKYNTRSEVVLDGDDGRIRGVRNRENKTFVLGGLFPIHADSPNPLDTRCGEVRQERGLERMEAMLFALDRINADPRLLPGVELGYDIRDTCNSETVGLDEAIDLIITGSNLEICETPPTAVTTVNGTIAPTSGIVGAAGSRVSVPVASLGRLFRMPQVSYASSSQRLSDRERYQYFHRTIPADDQQARAMVDILEYFGWNYVSAVHSDDTYGSPGVDEFEKIAENRGICMTLRERVPTPFPAAEYDKLVQRLIDAGPKVVIIFANQETVREILTRINRNKEFKRAFMFIASDAWARSIDLVHEFNDTAAGLYGVAPYTVHSNDFQNYFSQLTVNSNVRNDWFPEYFAAYANCSLDMTCNNASNVTSFSRYQQGNFIPLVIDAVYTFAYALHNFLDDNCNSTDSAPFVWFVENATCLGQTRDLIGSALLEYIQNSNFTSDITNNMVQFNEEGNVQGVYEILNYQASKTNDGLSYSFRSVGLWDSTREEPLSIMDDSLQYGLNDDDSIRTAPVESQCGGCGPGEYARDVPGSCCILCQPCRGRNYSDTYLAPECRDCMEKGDREMWGNNPTSERGSNSCVLIPENIVSYNDLWAIPSLILACAGLLCVAATAAIFGWFWRTAVVKSSGREQMVLLLTGISCSFILAFFYLAPPSTPICLIHRLGIWLCYSLMFGAITIKVQRVARIFYGIKRNLNYTPRFVSPVFQVSFTLLIVAAQMVIIVISLAFVHPVAQRKIRYNEENSFSLPEVIITCTEEHTAVIVISMLYETAIISAATILGVFSFKFPDNFNEAKYISFCTFALLIVWIGLIPTYFATQSQQEFQNAAISFFVILSGFAVLIFMFGPKLFLMLFQPQKNSTHFSTHHTANGNDGPQSPGIGLQGSYRDGMCVCIYSVFVFQWPLEDIYNACS